MEYAERFHAMVVQIEHRFYGKTQPLSDLSDESLRFLTSEQVPLSSASLPALPRPSPFFLFFPTYFPSLTPGSCRCRHLHHIAQD